VHHMRGGTSTGLVLWNAVAPACQDVKEELLRHLMGVPLTGENVGNRQITGLGRGPATSNKVFFADIEHLDGYPRLVSTLAQLAASHGRIDWSVNCGNMSSALQLWALATGLVGPSESGLNKLEIRNTNTGVITTSRMKVQADGSFEVAAIPGVMGEFPAVDLFLQSPAGAKTGTLLPTGSPIDVINGVRVSCVDVAVPMVIIRASELGKTAHEPVCELEADKAFMTRLKEIWVTAGLKMGLRRKDGALLTEDEIRVSETIPKVCIVAQSKLGADLAVRYFTPQTGHASLAVSGGCCLAAATLVAGSVAHELAPKNAAAEMSEFHVNIENPAGVLSTTVVAASKGGKLAIRSAAYQRSAQVLLSGYVPLYGATKRLKDALELL
jgi:4-oxalomesaconate tautomerase